MDIQPSDQQRGGALSRNHWRERLCNHMVLVQTGLRYPGPAATAGARRGGFRGMVRRARRACQSASNFDPRSASNFDPLERRVRAVALAPSELVGVAETARARVGE